VIPGVSFDVTYPGRAIGRWSLTLQGSSDGATWRLVRETVGPGAGWENHVARVTRRLRRFLADPERCEFVIVDSPDGYVQVCTLEHDTALRYEAAGELNLARAAAIAPGLSDRLRALGFDGPDDEAEGNYFRVGPAPVDARALAHDMLIVLAEAYGLRPEDRITAIDAATSVDGKGTRRLLPVHLGAASAGARTPAVIDRDDESPGSPEAPLRHGDGPAATRPPSDRVGGRSPDESVASEGNGLPIVHVNGEGAAGMAAQQRAKGHGGRT
jgi:hypothetical protein